MKFVPDVLRIKHGEDLVVERLVLGAVHPEHLWSRRELAVDLESSGRTPRREAGDADPAGTGIGEERCGLHRISITRVPPC